MNNKKIILGLAPIGGWGQSNRNPIHAEDIVRQVCECAQEGVSLVHLHARDKQGHLSADTRYFAGIIQSIKKSSKVILEASTGGLSSLTPSERALPLKVKNIEMGSLNMGSLNFGDQVYINRLPDIRNWIQVMQQYQIQPCMEIFDTSHMRIAHLIIKEKLIKPPYHFNFIFNCQWGMAFSLPLLQILVDMLPKHSQWGVVFAQNYDFKGHLKAILWGANMIRVGFEDSQIYKGQYAENNIVLVKEIRRLIKNLGYQLATPKEARELFQLSC